MFVMIRSIKKGKRGIKNEKNDDFIKCSNGMFVSGM